MDAENWDATACIGRVRQGDESAARELLAEMHPLVLRLVRAHRPRRVDEEDLIQTVFMRVFAKLDQFSGAVPLSHWVSRIAVNTCLKTLRYERVRPEIRLADLTEEEEQVVLLLATTSDDLPGNMDVGSRELLDRLLGGLRAEDRLVVTMLNLEQRTVAEISQITGWSGPLVKVRAFRARRTMKRLLESLLMKAER